MTKDGHNITRTDEDMYDDNITRSDEDMFPPQDSLFETESEYLVQLDVCMYVLDPFKFIYIVNR